jgi:hypothetical protein
MDQMKRTKPFYLQQIFPTLVFLLLIFLSAFLTLYGIRFYQKTNQKSRSGFQSETVEDYLRQKVRSADSEDGVKITNFGDSQALLLLNQTGGKTYRTLLYLDQGKLMEIYASKDAALSPEAGNEIAELSGWELTLEKPDLLYCRLQRRTTGTETIYIPIETGGEEE